MEQGPEREREWLKRQVVVLTLLKEKERQEPLRQAERN